MERHDADEDADDHEDDDIFARVPMDDGRRPQATDVW